MQREGTDGVSSRDGIMEVAFEQWTEGAQALVSSNVIPTLQGGGIESNDFCTEREQREFSEFRW